MREQDFRAWLEIYPAKTKSGKLVAKTVSTYITDIKRVVKDAGIDGNPLDIDASFEDNGLVPLIALYNYTKADEDARKANPTNTVGETNSLSNFLKQYRRAIILYREFLLSNGEAFINEEEDTDTYAVFGLEKDLQDVIRENLAQLEAGLVIADGGVECRVASGRIDILAKDTQGRFVVIELKVGIAEGRVIGQILGYMADIAEAEKQEIDQVRGIIIAADFNKRVRSAVKLTPFLELKSYRYNFQFTSEN